VLSGRADPGNILLGCDIFDGSCVEEESVPTEERAMSSEFDDLAAARTAHLYRSAWLLCGDAHRAEDLVQETLEKVYVRMTRRIGPRVENPAAYAQTTLVRTFISARRRRSDDERPVRADAEQCVDAGRLDPDADLRLALREALAELAPLDRAVLVLRFLDDLPVDEVAGLLGLSATAVRSRTHRALSRLRRVLGTALPDLLST
jgi:RNA polymerase sigma-70 factor (sigma-E family)